MKDFFCSWWFIVIFWGIALIASVLFAIYAWDIHGGTKPKKGARLNQQLFLNLLGSFVGWVMLWIVLPSLIDSIKTHSSTNFNLNDIILTIIAFIGITGYLPVALVRLALGLKDLLPKPKEKE